MTRASLYLDRRRGDWVAQVWSDDRPRRCTALRWFRTWQDGMDWLCRRLQP